MELWLQTVIAVFTSVMASSGLWAYILARRERKEKQQEKEEEKNSASNRMLLGLGHDRITYLCSKYIERGWISNDEYEDLMKYLYEPYKDMGGNGTAERLINEVKKLPIHKISYVQQAKNRTNREG